MPATDTKSAIRREALRLFSERGFAAVSMRELAEAVGMHQGGIYNHFPSKQALLVDLMATHINALLEAHEAAMEEVQGPEAQLRAFVQNHVSYHLDYPKDVFLAYMELRSLDAVNRKDIVALRNRYEQSLRTILEEGRSRGLFRIDDAAVHARMLLSMLTGATTWYRDDGRLDRDAIVACHVRGAMQSVGLEVTEP
ncbi:MAG: TetR/AcrR family transcriptional regulator [Silicimonas sp.]|nr:TetR/AcrR family transcriptional regulator [Silicimonas sp.]